MKSPIIRIVSLFVLGLCPAVEAGVQEAWMQKYNAGRSEGTNQAVAMSMDSRGNIIVAGSSQSTNGDFDYIVLKYAANGSNQWIQRYTSAGGSDDQVRALALDKQDNVFITGTSATVKYDAQGLLQWSAPFGGRALVPDTNGNIYVTGYSDVDFATVKLDQSGSNVWQKINDTTGHTEVAQQIALDGDGNVYVGGAENYVYEPRFLADWWRYRMISYQPDGTQRFSTPFASSAYGRLFTEIRGLYAAQGDNIIVTGNLGGSIGKTYCVGTISFVGEFIALRYLIPTELEGMRASCASANSEVLLTGSTLVDQFGHTTLRTYKALTNAMDGTVAETQPDWQADYVGLNAGYHRGNAMALDAAGNVYVAGQSTGAGTAADWQDWATIKYSPDGQQQWVKRYNGPAHLNDVATCMAVTPAGEVYVAGWSQSSSNLVELVVIKYVELQNIQVLPNQNVLLQFLETPGQSNRVQGTTDFVDWLDLGISAADPNGMVRFLDTNAPSYPFRFYRIRPLP